jgi:hypothetical protein
MTKTVQGIVRGKTIELAEDLGVAEGQQVEVRVKVIEAGQKWGEGILRSAGAAADTPEWDDIMAEIARQRKATQFREKGNEFPP